MISCYINPNKAGLFDGRIFWGRGGGGGGGGLTPPSYCKKNLCNINIT